MSIVIFEGTDMVGKSSLMKDFCERTDYTEYKKDSIQHPFSFRKEMDKWKFFSLGMSNEHMNVFKAFDNFAIDRAFVSEFVYSEFYKRESFLTEEIIGPFYEKLKNRITTILIECNYEDYVDRHKKVSETYWLSESDFLIQQKLFRDYCNKFSGHHFLSFNTSDSNPIQEILKAVSYKCFI